MSRNSNALGTSHKRQAVWPAAPADCAAGKELASWRNGPLRWRGDARVSSPVANRRLPHKSKSASRTANRQSRWGNAVGPAVKECAGAKAEKVGANAASAPADGLARQN